MIFVSIDGYVLIEHLDFKWVVWFYTSSNSKHLTHCCIYSFQGNNTEFIYKSGKHLKIRYVTTLEDTLLLSIIIYLVCYPAPS